MGTTEPEITTEQQILQSLREGPGAEIEFCAANVRAIRLAETMTAMANSRGGMILIGISGHPPRLTGVPHAEQTVELALQASMMPSPPLIVPLPEAVEVEGKAVVLVTVPSGLPHIYRFRGRYLARSGRTNETMSTAALRQLLLDRSATSFESLPAPGATLDDLDEGAVRAYADAFPSVTDDPLEMLRRRGCITRDGRPTYAGVLLFSHTPQQFVHSSSILVARYPGQEMGDQFLREEITGPLPEQIRRTEAFVVDNMRVGARLVGLEREEIAEYPQPVVREAIVNAVAHRDYSIRGEEIRLLMFSDRIEVYSPGRLPGHVTLRNLLDERYSRNEVIVQVLSDMGFIERLGYGIDRMVRMMREEGLPEPGFTETANGFQVTLYGHGDRLLTTDRVTRSRWAHLLLNERQEKALQFLSERGRITNRDFQSLCPDVSAETIRRDLVDLVNRGLLLKIGEKRATYYIFK
jgi:ATP-dependent DNA helicase RecG